jgi:hypothetical protein
VTSKQKRFLVWLLEGTKATSHGTETHHKSDWWNVMCLTGVDYFSTLGYQPGIAYLAAATLSPLATLILVLLTLFGALPVYMRVSRESFHGQGSIAMLEKLLEGWKGKTLVLVLLGFAATSFVITITLSAADATAHIIENPYCPDYLKHRIGITLLLLSVLAGVFMLGFREAIGVAVILVWAYLTLNAIVIWQGFEILQSTPNVFAAWYKGLVVRYHDVLTMVAISMGMFPKLALGLSGFETGVSVIPLVKGQRGDTPDRPLGQIAATKKLLLVAAVIMSIFLITSSIITTLLIPAGEFAEGGQANGRALAYLAHKFFGDAFGTAYDISTISILWFAGASAIVGLLNLVPRYLPRYGMAPDWARATRPLVLFITLVCFTVTFVFNADVDQQAGAYATGVLSLITSAAVAVTLAAKRDKQRFLSWVFGIIALVFIYTTAVNIYERPEGLQIALFFICSIVIVSFGSRAARSLELRIGTVQLDEKAQAFIENTIGENVRLLAHRPGGSDYELKEEESRITHTFEKDEGEFIFLEIDSADPSQFVDEILEVSGHEEGGVKILRCNSPAIPNAIAALLLHIQKATGKTSHVYMGWTEGNPFSYILKFIFLGIGETAPLTREILRRQEADPRRRPKVHVG